MKKTILKLSLAAAATAGILTFAFAPKPAEANGASLACESLGGFPGGYLCDAFPDSPDYTYSWTASGGVYLPAAPPNSSSRQVQCRVGSNGGYVTVTIGYPDGSHDTVGRSLPCAGVEF